MPSRKMTSVKWGVLLAAIVNGLAGVLVALGFDADIVFKISGTLSAVIAALFGLNVAAIAHEDAALKRQMPAPALEQQIQAAARAAEQRAVDQARRLGEQASSELKARLEDAVRRLQEARHT